MTREKAYVFKRKGNKEQAAFNEWVEVVTDAQAKLETVGGAPAVEWAKAVLQKGAQLLLTQKLIRIADRSEFGWGVVAEYIADELAEDSDDEKHLKKAEKAAKRKAVKCTKKSCTEPSTRGMSAGRGRPVVG